jgi:hypothetical protein
MRMWEDWRRRQGLSDTSMEGMAMKMAEYDLHHVCV